MATFPERILLLQSEKGCKKKDIAIAVGVSYRGWQYIERGIKEPTLGKIIKLADYFDVSIDYLVGRSDSRSRR